MHYNPDFITHRTILNATEADELSRLSTLYPLTTFLNDARNFEEMMVDFVYTSAKIEGNTYDRIDTDNLLRLGITAGGKRYSDAVMLRNLRNSFERIMNIQTDAISLDLDYLCDTHAILMKDLLEAAQIGSVRTSPVTIGATRYKPPARIQQLRDEVKIILECAPNYNNPFEQAIYLHCNLAYLQYFKDGNKRTARMMQTAALVNHQVLPLFFQESLIDRYVRALVSYYETGDYSAYIAFFIDNYRLNIMNFLGLEDAP
jgi:Fic family protein